MLGGKWSIVLASTMVPITKYLHVSDWHCTGLQHRVHCLCQLYKDRWSLDWNVVTAAASPPPLATSCSLIFYMHFHTKTLKPVNTTDVILYLHNYVLEYQVGSLSRSSKGQGHIYTLTINGLIYRLKVSRWNNVRKYSRSVNVPTKAKAVSTCLYKQKITQIQVHVH